MKNHKLISRFIPLLLVVIFSSSCSVIFSNRRTAYRQIDEIKNSFVLVRLKSSQKKVQYLKLNNRDSEVNEEIAKTEKENEEIKKAFREEYKFSDFYFFDSSDYANIKSRAFDKVEITDRDDNLVNDKSFLENDFYIIIFGNREQPCGMICTRQCFLMTMTVEQDFFFFSCKKGGIKFSFLKFSG